MVFLYIYIYILATFFEQAVLGTSSLVSSLASVALDEHQTADPGDRVPDPIRRGDLVGAPSIGTGTNGFNMRTGTQTVMLPVQGTPLLSLN